MLMVSRCVASFSDSPALAADMESGSSQSVPCHTLAYWLVVELCNLEGSPAKGSLVCTCTLLQSLTAAMCDKLPALRASSCHCTALQVVLCRPGRLRSASDILQDTAPQGNGGAAVCGAVPATGQHRAVPCAQRSCPSTALCVV